MPVGAILSMIPVTELLKLVISMAKKVKDFKPLFLELASTMQRLVPIIQEMERLQESVEPGNRELNFLTKTLRRAKKMVRKCSRVREYNALKKISYAETIKAINGDFLKFCQLDLPLIQHRNLLRSLSLKTEESSHHNSNISTSDEDEQQVMWESFKDKGKGKAQVQDQEDEQLVAALQESLKMQELDHSARKKAIFHGRQQEQQVILESSKDKGKDKQIQEEDEQVFAALQESLKTQELDHSARKKAIVRARQQEKQVILESSKDKGKDNQVQEEDEHVFAALQDSLKTQELDHSARKKAIVRARQQEQQVILESSKDKGKDKQVQEEDEQVFAALQESLKMQELDHSARKKAIVRARQQEQQVILESSKDKGKDKQVQEEDEHVFAALQASLKMQELDHSARKKAIVRARQQEQQVILESSKDKGKDKQVQEEDEQVFAALQESLKMQELDHSARKKAIVRARQQEQQVILESSKDKGKDKQVQEEDEHVFAALQDSLKMQELDHSARKKAIVRARQQEQQVILESSKDKGKDKQVQEEDEQVFAALQESLKMQELDHSARKKAIVRARQQEQQVILESSKDKGKDKQVQKEDEQVFAALQESLKTQELDHSARKKAIFRGGLQEQQIILESSKNKRKDKQVQEEDELVFAALQDNFKDKRQ